MRYMPLLPYPRIWQESHILGGGPQPPHEPRDVLHRRLVDRYAQRLKELQPQLQARRIRAQRRRGPVQRLQVRKEGLHLTHRLAAPVEHRPRLRLVRHQHPLHPHPDLPHAVHHEHHRSQLRQSYPTRSAREHARRLPTRPSGRADEHEGHTGHDQENASTTALSTQRSDVEDTPRGLQRIVAMPNADFRATGSGHRSSGGACPIVGRLCTVTGRVVSAGWVRRRWWVVVVWLLNDRTVVPVAVDRVWPKSNARESVPVNDG